MTEESYASVGGERGMEHKHQVPLSHGLFFWFKIKSKVDYTHIIIFAFEV